TTVGSRVLGGALPASLAGLASIAGHAGRLGTRQLARPKGEIGSEGRRVRSRTRAAPVRAPEQGSRPGGGGSRRSLMIRTALWLVPLLAGVVLAVAAWALDGWASLLTAIAAGVFVGLALPPFLLLAVLWDNPPRPAGRPPIPPEGSEG
ncbi:MAG: hypothetical protein K0R11_1503, partial [Acidimicrobiales bacterium]|nr:hypothetical protein [Acidimicrobiales bacterium]